MQIGHVGSVSGADTISWYQRDSNRPSDLSSYNFRYRRGRSGRGRHGETANDASVSSHPRHAAAAQIRSHGARPFVPPAALNVRRNNPAGTCRNAARAEKRAVAIDSPKTHSKPKPQASSTAGYNGPGPGVLWLTSSFGSRSTPAQARRARSR